MNLEPTPFSFTEIQESKLPQVIKHNVLKVQDGIHLAYYPYLSKKEKANLIFIHGGGAHSGAGYQNIASKLSTNFNISTYLIDLRGHGKSEGIRGDTNKVDSLFSDLDSIIQLVKANSKNPIYLGGHSSGAGLVLNYLSNRKINTLSGIIFLSPELGYKSNTHRDNIIQPFAVPNLGIFILSAFSGKTLFSHSMAVTFNYPDAIIKKDPLLLKGITTNMAYALTPDMPEEQCKKIALPIAIMIGDSDELIDPVKLSRYMDFIPDKIKKRSIFKIIKRKNHLSVLLHTDDEIGKIITRWNSID